MIDPRFIFRLLNREHVEAILVGGMAMVVQRVTHFTNDLDLCYQRTPDNIEHLIQALADLHPRLRVEGLTDAEARALPFHWDRHALGRAENLTLTTDAGDLDVLGHLAGVGDYTHLLPYVETLVIDDVPIAVLSLEGLMLSKRAAGRAKDLIALPHIEAALLLSRTTDAEDA